MRWKQKMEDQWLNWNNIKTKNFELLVILLFGVSGSHVCDINNSNSQNSYMGQNGHQKNHSGAVLSYCQTRGPATTTSLRNK